MQDTNTRDLRSEAAEISTVIQILGGPTHEVSEHTKANDENKDDSYECSTEETNSTSDVNIGIKESLTTVDQIDADVPETFTLEEFRKIILEFRRNNKDCILARVSTPDHESSEVLFDNYYVASEVNKLLFKFERDRRLLHRMKVRNPLNNQPIIGPVHYYRVTCAEIDKSIVDYFFGVPKNEEKDKRRIHSSVLDGLMKNTNMNQVENKESNNNITEDKKNRISSDISIKSNMIEEMVEECPWTIIEEVKAGNLKVPERKIIQNAERIPSKITYIASYFACDDDFLMRADIREYFRVNSMDPSEEFLFELDRAHNDLFALLDTASDSNDEDIVGWKRILAIHMSMLITLLGVIILLSGFPIILFVTFPLAIIILLSFLFSLLYIMLFRRDTFGSLAVQSIEDEV